jgi:MFS family permease
VTSDAHASQRSGYRWIVLSTVLIVQFAQGTVNTVLSAALKDVAVDLGSTEATMAWAITAPFLAIGIGNPIFGRLGDVRSRRRMFLIGVAVFALCTAGAALAQNSAALILTRAGSGIGTSIAMPNGMATVLGYFNPEERTRALGWFNLVGISAPAMGLVLGGVMIDALGWRSLFVIYGVVAGIGFIAALAFLHERGIREAGAPRSIDIAGSLALGTATLAAMLGLTFVARRGLTDVVTLALLVLAPIAAVVFVVVERRTRDPLVPLRYFRRPGFSGPMAAYFAGHIAYMGGFVISPILLKDVFGYTKLSKVTAFLILRPLTFGLASPIGARFEGRFGARRTALTGSVAMLASMALFVVTTLAESEPLLVVALVLSGLSFGLVTAPFAASVSNSVDQTDLGVAQGIFNTAISLGTVTGIQIVLLALGDAAVHDSHDFLAPYAIGGAGALAMVASSLLLSDQRRSRNST